MIEKLPFGTKLKPILDNNNIYRNCKYSEIGLWLWRKVSPKNNDILKREDKFFTNLLRLLKDKTSPIFDIGSNVGWVSKTFLRFSNKVVAVEPDKFCQEVLMNRFGKTKAFTLISKAVSNEESSKAFFIQESGSALNTLSDKWRIELEAGFLKKKYLFKSKKVIVPTTTIDLLIDKHGLPSLAKIDVEGHELEVIKCLNQPIPLIVFEANLPSFLEETEQIIETLKMLDKNVTFNYSLNFEVILHQYVSPSVLLKEIKKKDKCSIDIICRMSNYNDYFNLQ